MSEQGDLLDKWKEFRNLFETLELDVIKNAKGVAAAGVRLRKGLRQLQKQSKELIKFTVERDKKPKEE